MKEKTYNKNSHLVNWSRLWVRCDGVPDIRVLRCWWWLDWTETEYEVEYFHSTEL